MIVTQASEPGSANNMQDILSQFDPLAKQKPHTEKEATLDEKESKDSKELKEPKEAHEPRGPKESKGKIPISKEHTLPSISSLDSTEKTPSQAPEPTLPPPFDFQWFLDLLRHKSADPIARYLKSFLSEFNKRTWSAQEQVKIIIDFKTFIFEKMQLCPPFSKLSEAEMDNAMEGMEKLIMNRLYTRTFSPEIPEARRDDSHEEDIIIDRVLNDKMTIWHWIEGRHLDIPNRFLRNGEAFVKLASDELNKINHYRAPRDKVVCVLNCCKVIFGLLRQTKHEENADSFLPILIYVVIKAHPANLISNINYIQRFRNPDKLFGEAGYYLSSFQGAVSFVETLDIKSLSITEEEFNRKVDESIAPKADISQQPPVTPDRGRTPDHSRNNSGNNTSPRAQANLAPSAVLQNSAGLLAVPFKSITNLFQSEPVSPQNKSQISLSGPGSTPNLSTTDARLSTGYSDADSSQIQEKSQDANELQTNEEGILKSDNPQGSDPTLSPEELAARQISAEEEEARRITENEFESVVDALSQMFPVLDRNVIIDVATEKEGRVGAAVDACLSLLS